MMKEVESGKVGTILIKDMSRMGRDYLKVGHYMELLRQKNVRLIADDVVELLVCERQRFGRGVYQLLVGHHGGNAFPPAPRRRRLPVGR